MQEMGKNTKYLIIGTLVTIVFVFCGGAIGVLLLNSTNSYTQTGSESDTGNIADEPISGENVNLGTNASGGILLEDQKYYEYTEFSNEWLSFYYPVGWETEVVAGDTAVLNCESTINCTNTLPGINSILISDRDGANSFYIAQNYNSFGYGPGGARLSVNDQLTEASVILLSLDSDQLSESKYEFSKPYSIRHIEEFGIYLVAAVEGFNELTNRDSDAAIEDKVYIAHSPDWIDEYLLLDNEYQIAFIPKTQAFDFIGHPELNNSGNETSKGFVEFNVDCSIETQADTEACLEWVTNFFNSVEKKK